MESVEVADVYSTQEPQKAFHARIAFCLDIHNDVSVWIVSFLHSFVGRESHEIRS